MEAQETAIVTTSTGGINKEEFSKAAAQYFNTAYAKEVYTAMYAESTLEERSLLSLHKNIKCNSMEYVGVLGCVVGSMTALASIFLLLWSYIMQYQNYTVNIDTGIQSLLTQGVKAILVYIITAFIVREGLLVFPYRSRRRLRVEFGLLQLLSIFTLSLLFTVPILVGPAYILKKCLVHTLVMGVIFVTGAMWMKFAVDLHFVIGTDQNRDPLPSIEARQTAEDREIIRQFGSTLPTKEGYMACQALCRITAERLTAQLNKFTNLGRFICAGTQERENMLENMLSGEVIIDGKIPDLDKLMAEIKKDSNNQE